MGVFFNEPSLSNFLQIFFYIWKLTGLSIEALKTELTRIVWKQISYLQFKSLYSTLQLEAEQDRNFTMVNMFRILGHDPCCLY